MNTPILNFAENYAAAGPVRMHMPGHKGTGRNGVERMDITEIPGADVLYASNGIIRESEENASKLFGSARTVYSTEGSSLCIRAMLYLAHLYAEQNGKRSRIAAGRNAHRVFQEAAAMLDPELFWVGTGEDLLGCRVTEEELAALFQNQNTAPTAVYLTSPDYLGRMAEIARIADLCHRHSALLLVDNAHGAYLKFLPGQLHPLEQGADLCCDSAHKTLPALTGAAYLHASSACPKELLPLMERAMALFASTSPSYLILQSLDAVNAKLAGELPERLSNAAGRTAELKKNLADCGWALTGSEPLKLTLHTKPYGYTGKEVAACLSAEGIICEFSDPDYVVLMPGESTEPEEYEKLLTILSVLEQRPAITERAPVRNSVMAELTLREAMLSPYETVQAADSIGRILATPSVSCPPAVPICICGERIDRAAVMLFQYYGIEFCDVVVEKRG